MGQAQPGEGLLAEPIDALPPRLLPHRGSRYLGRALGMGAAAAVFTALLHGPLGGLLSPALAATLPHVLLAFFLFGALRLAGAGGGPQGEGAVALAYPLAAGFSLAVLFPVAAPVGILLFGGFLGAGLAPELRVPGARLRHGMVMGAATLLASLVFGTLTRAHVLGDLSPLVQTALLGGLWGFVVGAGAVPRHLVSSSREAVEALVDELPALEGEPASFAGRALTLHGRVCARMTPDLFERPEDFERLRRELDDLLSEVRTVSRAWQDGEARFEHEDVKKKLQVAREQLEESVDEQARASYRAMVERLEARLEEKERFAELRERHRSRLQLLETILEELDLTSQTFEGGSATPEALARLREQLAGRPASPALPG